MLSVIIISYKRKKDLIECVSSIQNNVKVPFEIIIVHNDRKEIACNCEKINEIIPHKNLGVADGRNYGVTFSRYKYLFFIDDDAVLISKITSETLKLLSNQTPVLAVHSIDYYSNKLRVKENVTVNRKGYCNKYVGVGHFILKKTFKELAGYEVVGKYGMEEINFQYKMLNVGKKILHSNIKVKHKKSEIGRNLTLEKKINLGTTKIRLISKHAPTEIIFLHYLLWSLYIMKTEYCFMPTEFLFEILSQKKSPNFNRLSFYRTSFATSTNILY